MISLVVSSCLAHIARQRALGAGGQGIQCSPRLSDARATLTHARRHRQSTSLRHSASLLLPPRPRERVSCCHPFLPLSLRIPSSSRPAALASRSWLPVLRTSTTLSSCSPLSAVSLRLVHLLRPCDLLSPQSRIPRRICSHSDGHRTDPLVVSLTFISHRPKPGSCAPFPARLARHRCAYDRYIHSTHSENRPRQMQTLLDDLTGQAIGVQAHLSLGPSSRANRAVSCIQHTGRPPACSPI